MSQSRRMSQAGAMLDATPLLPSGGADTGTATASMSDEASIPGLVTSPRAPLPGTDAERPPRDARYQPESSDEVRARPHV